MSTTWSAVDDYLTQLFDLADPALESAIADSTAAGLPTIAVSRSLGRLLHFLAQLVGARRILEIGTLGGYSAIWLARALPPDGRLTTLELERRHAEVARANLDRAGVGDRVDIRVGPAQDGLAILAAERREPFDFVFIDADKTGYSAYLDAVIPLARRGALIVADNVVRNGAVADTSSTDANVRGVRAFLAKCAGDARITTVALQTVGAKGYDGIALARVV